MCRLDVVAAKEREDKNATQAMSITLVLRSQFLRRSGQRMRLSQTSLNRSTMSRSRNTRTGTQ